MKKLCKDNEGKLYYLDDITGNKLYLDKEKKSKHDEYHDIRKQLEK